VAAPPQGSPSQAGMVSLLQSSRVLCCLGGSCGGARPPHIATLLVSPESPWACVTQSPCNQYVARLLRLGSRARLALGVGLRALPEVMHPARHEHIMSTLAIQGGFVQGGFRAWGSGRHKGQGFGRIARRESKGGGGWLVEVLQEEEAERGEEEEEGEGLGFRRETRGRPALKDLTVYVESVLHYLWS
jgi:hypothetical protein